MNFNENFLQNAYPEMHVRMPDRLFTENEFQQTPLPIDSREVFDYIRDIKDPEHPMTLEELNVVSLDLIKVEDENCYCFVEFTPTIPHCSMATLIGLTIKVHLLRVMPPRFKIDVCIVPDTHNSYAAINKQLADKERVAAALENVHLAEVINDCILLPEEQTLPPFVEKVLKEQSKLDHPKVKYIQSSRQHIESYRRWKEIINENLKS
ncbi:MIP18 family protein galla-2-like [Uloborus diversus]|uniref:MIP18 family protein galla-2-like n=1 Tax=Uloborus diversus TaxID=327109 RepID=UPI0024099CC5|nr:MIP18 family protein galla-2-like [Uloborus diversus]